MAWFDYLKESGFFDPDKNPQPVITERGAYMPHWDALDYLEKLSLNFAAGKDLELAGEVVNIIRNVSQHPVDNYHTWYRLINILSKVPAENIPGEILDYMPVWVTTKYDSSIVTSALAETLFAHFLKDEPSEDSIAKAGKLFENLLEIRKKWDAKTGEPASTRNYYTAYDLYNLTHSLLETDNFKLICQYFDLQQASILLEKINILCRDQVGNVELHSSNVKSILKIQPVDNELRITITEETGNEPHESFYDVIENYAKRECGWEIVYFNTIFEKLHIDDTSIAEAMKRISFTLYNDFESLMGLEPISDLKENQTVGNAVLNAFALIFRNWVQKIAKSDVAKTRSILIYLNEGIEFQLPFFRRMIIYIAGKNWAELKDIFWKVIDQNKNEAIFSIDLYKVELYELLKEVQSQLDKRDVKKIKSIIESGPVGERHYSASPDAWSYRWLDALQNNPAFSENFKTIAAKFSRKPDFSTDGRVNIRVGHVAPMTVEEMQAASVGDIAHTLKTFKSTGRWEDPTEEGLADIFGQTVEEDPERFVEQIGYFDEVIYLYAYHLLYGLQKALKKGKTFDWEPALNYCYRYITSKAFETDALYSDVEPRASKEWIFGDIGTLISESSKEQNEGFQEQELLIAEKIIVFICAQLKPNKIDENCQAKQDYIMYSLNSTQGKVLRALLDCSLKDARIQQNAGKKVKWKKLLKDTYTQALADEILDSYTLEGMYLPQFMFLDDPWLRAQVVGNQTLDFSKWAAFMGGIGFGKPISGDYYPIMLPNYQRAVDIPYIDTHYNSGILRHLLAFYFWDYEASFEETLLYQALEKADGTLIKELIMLVNQQRPSLMNLPETEYTRLFLKIVRIWEVLLQKFENADPAGNDDFQQMTWFVDFVRAEDLNEEKTELIIKTIGMLKDFGFSSLLKRILKLSNPANASYIGRLMAGINFSYVFEKEILVQLLQFLYQNQQTKVANDIISKLTIRGADFLKPLYLKYNSV